VGIAAGVVSALIHIPIREESRVKNLINTNQLS